MSESDAQTQTARIAGRFGKRAARPDYRTLRFGDYIDAALTPKPEVYNIGRALTALRLTANDIGTLWPMDGNDQLGDCAMAALAHTETLWDAFVGKRIVAPTSLVEKVYFQRTGGSDTGLVLIDVLNWWRQNRFNGDNILGYVSINPANHDHVKIAIELFGCVYIGFQCTTNIEQQFETRVPWTPGTLTTDGHCVTVPNYNVNTLRCLTWGGDQDMTWAFFDQCVDEVYALLPPEAMLKGFNPAFNFTQLNADLRSVSN